MSTSLIFGTRIVFVALIAYSIGICWEQKKRRGTNGVLAALTIGILFDILATLFMLLGSPNSPFSLHGFIGYSALLAMVIDTVLIWRFRLTNGADAEIFRSLHLYSRFAYIWWIAAFVTGFVLVMLK